MHIKFVRELTLNKRTISNLNQLDSSKIFSSKELKVFKIKAKQMQFLASRVAAKMAVVDCMIHTLGKELPIGQVEILQDANGAPRVVIHSDDVDCNCTSNISITHTDKSVVAIAWI